MGRVILNEKIEKDSEAMRDVYVRTMISLAEQDADVVALDADLMNSINLKEFAQKFPNLVSKIITLDNRRMPLPRTMHPRVYSLRSSDQPADDGVLPTAAEAAANKIRILKLPHTNHNDMDDRADDRQRKEIQEKLLLFLRQ